MCDALRMGHYYGQYLEIFKLHLHYFLCPSSVHRCFLPVEFNFSCYKVQIY